MARKRTDIDANTTDIDTNTFERNMELRRRMFEVSGADLPEYSRLKDKEELFHKSVANCYSCKQVDLCVAWLNASEKSEAPPEFCPNYDLIHELLARRKKAQCQD